MLYPRQFPIPLRGITADLRRRRPYYASDWTAGFEQQNLERVIRSTMRMYFLNLIPALSYVLDMNERTNGSYGVNEALLASAIAAILFSIFSISPLTIVGITGLTNLFNYTVYDIIKGQKVDYLQFQAWILIWSGISHALLAAFNACDVCLYVTDMTTETFGLYVGVIYIQKGIELLILDFTSTQASGWFSVVVAILFVIFVYVLDRAGAKDFLPFGLRQILMDFSFASGVILFAGITHIPGNINDAGLSYLPITASFEPSTSRAWIIRFWELPIQWIFIALPFSFLVTILFFFDHNVSSLMAHSKAFPVSRPAGFHFDFFLLGIMTFISGILGLPAPNGLVPQAPFNTESLCILKVVKNEDEKCAELPVKVIRTRVVEQRLSHLLMGLLILATMSPPLLTVLGTIARPVFSGVFIIVGWGSVETNPIVHRILYLMRDSRFIPLNHPLRGLKRSSILKYISIQLFFFAGITAISQTIAAIGFPLIIMCLIPLRHFLLPDYFSSLELSILDAPTATSMDVPASISGPVKTTQEEQISEQSTLSGGAEKVLV